ncbi:hypothetical protein GWM83_02660, partial [Candidatus Bathyarchaeota archaeon]|nr:hypothetical protein [Desulfobacterales bacterium]NIW34447.1 hypothetical protein [Candidatus Bathyarchaeota archaeon]
MIRELYEGYKNALARGERAVSRGEKEQTKIAAAPRSDSYGGADKSPYEIALDTKEVKQDLGPIKGRADAFNKIEKTIQ